LELSVRLVIAVLLGCAPLFVACDRQSGEAPQEATPDRTSPPGQELPQQPAGGPSYAGSETIGRVSIDYRGMAAPDAVFVTAEGASVRLREYEGQPLLVNLWATWCAPCIAEMPTLDALAERLDGRMKVMTISEDFRGAEVVTPFFERYSFRRLEPWLDTENAMLAALGADTLPLTILYDADGAELFRVYGGMDWSGERARTLIAGALGERSD
jgi:thiol-disulfide isomerase/thioredoxin